MTKSFAKLFIGASLCATVALSASAEDTTDKPSVFDLPRLQATHEFANRAIAVLFPQGKYAEGEAVLRQALERLPHVANLHYNLACALAHQDKDDEALAALEKAVDLGFRDPNHIEQDPDLEKYHNADRFKLVLKKAGEPWEGKASPWNYSVDPGRIVDGIAMVTETNVAWNSNRGIFQVLFQFDETPPADLPIARGLGTVGDLLRAWYKEGSAAGNYGDLYDNHDSNHSRMNYGALPQLTRVEFGPAARERKLNHGTQLSMLYNGVTLGNSSTALTSGTTWRSQGRHVLMQPRGPLMLYMQYRASHLYFYPEHRDHDPGHNGKGGQGYGDLYPANTPYMIISQGSSGSDKVFMDAVGATLAAFRPEVKKELTKTGMLMPTVQLIFRMSNKNVTDADDYLTGKAHPSVFEGSLLDVEKMVTMAHDIQPSVLPPLATLKVVSEDEGAPGLDYFDVAPRERLCDTPCVIARVVRSTKYQRRVIVSAETSQDLRDKALTYHWVVLRGDAKKIEIKRLNASGSVVELLVSYHERRPVQPGSDMESNRVDIGAFVHNGTYYSPPAFVSFFYLDNEKRVYDRKKRIAVVDYVDAEMKGNYVDPLLDFKKDWRDEYRYDRAGHLEGWTRIRGKDAAEQFNAEGRLVVGDKGRKPVETREVRYTAEAGPDGTGRLRQQTIEEE